MGIKIFSERIGAKASNPHRRVSARVEDRSTQDKIKDAAAYAGRFFVMLSDVKLPEELFHVLQESNEHLPLVVVAVL